MLTEGHLLQRRYRVQRVLGTGGMGTVYLALDESLGDKRVAIKEMTMAGEDEVARQRATELFQNEARTLAALDHPGLVDVTHYFEHDGNQYLVMEFVDGQTLEAVVQQTPGFLPVVQCVDWMLQVADVLEYLHGRQPPVLFRDLKPSNVMLDARKAIRLIDFGISRVFDSSRTIAYLKGAGTAGFAPLEQLSHGTTDARSDIFALGATLYSLVTRSIPPDAVDLTTGQAVLTPPSKVNPEVPAYLEEAILTMMAIRKDGRYQTVTAARQAMLPPRASKGTDSSGTLKPGAVLEGRYVIEKRIAGSRMGAVYLAHLTSAETRKVAIKVLKIRHDSPEQHDRTMFHFRQEAAVLANLDHPNLVRVLEFFTVGARAYLVTDYVDGFSLAKKLESAPGLLDVSRVLDLVRQLCDALEYLHSRTPPVIFRDLKPANAMLTIDGNIKLVDFGLTDAILSEGTSKTDSFLRGTGTHGYAPIEQYMPAGTTDVTSDIYSLGATMYTLFTRLTPPAAVELVSGQNALVPPESINPAVPAALGALLRTMMATQKKDRCQSIDEVRRHLQRVFDRPTTGELRTVRTTPAVRAEPVAGLPPEAPARPSSDRLAEALPDRLSALYAAFRPNQVRLSASIQARGQFLGFDVPSMRMEPVTAVEVDTSGMSFKTIRSLKIPSIVRMRLSVPTHAKNVALDVDVRLVLTDRIDAETKVFLYKGLFKDMPPRLAPLLGNLERRRVRRVSEQFQIVGRDLPSHKAIAVDISPAGLGFTCHGALSVPSLVDLSLDLTESDTVSRGSTVIQVRIVHSARQMDGLYRVGARFASLSDTSARSLADYLQRWV